MNPNICNAFCDELKVTKVPCGLAVSTAFENPEGDRIGFYVVSVGDKYRIEDEGLLFPLLDSNGIDISKGTRGNAFTQLQNEYSVSFNKDTLEFQTELINESEVAHASLKFTAFMLRVWDFMLLHPHAVANTFKDDAKKAIEEYFSNMVIEHDKVIDDEHQFYVPDTILREEGKPPVAIYYATSSSKVDEAVILRLDSNIHHEELKVVLLQENAKSNISERSLSRAHNNLDATPVFCGDKQAALEKIKKVMSYEVLH